MIAPSLDTMDLHMPEQVLRAAHKRAGSGGRQHCGGSASREAQAPQPRGHSLAKTQDSEVRFGSL